MLHKPVLLFGLKIFFLDLIFLYRVQKFYIFIRWVFCFWDFWCKTVTNIDKKEKSLKVSAIDLLFMIVIPFNIRKFGKGFSFPLQSKNWFSSYLNSISGKNPKFFTWSTFFIKIFWWCISGMSLPIV